MSNEHAGHAHGVIGPGDRPRQRRALRIVLLLNSVMLVGEVVGGILTGSLALLADAAHMLSDVGGIVIALGALRLAERPHTDQHTFGLQRAEVLGALANGVLLVATAGWILVEAGSRIGDAPDVEGGPLLAIALLGLAVNIGSAIVLACVAGASLNMRGALVHMIADAAGSVAVLIAAGAVLLADATWVDPAAAIAIALLVAWSSWGLLRDTVHVLLEGTPRRLDVHAVTAALESAPEVVQVHHVHLWALASDVPALSAHVVVDGEPALHEAQHVSDALRSMLAERFGIAHATFELECHPCDAPETH